MKRWLLWCHRWIALIFAVPLAVILASGIVLSFEPWIVTSSIAPGTLKAERVVSLLEKHDAEGKARMLSFRAYDRTLGVGRGTYVDVESGEVREPSSVGTILLTARRLHETLLLDLGWVVLASTIAMLALVVVGLAMGWPRLANSLSGWHQGFAWGVLPLVVLSPLTGLMLALHISLAAPAPPAPESAPITFADAVRVVGREHDLASLVWLRARRGMMLARLVENGEYKVFAVSKDGTVALPRNWPRLWHEGNFAGVWSALLNVIASFAMSGLLVTGIWIWSRRQLRRQRNRRLRAQAG